MKNTVNDPNTRSLRDPSSQTPDRTRLFWRISSAREILEAAEQLCGKLEQLHSGGFLCLNLSPEYLCYQEESGYVLAENIPLNSVSDPDGCRKWILPPEKNYTAPELLWGISDSYFQHRRMQQYGQRADIYSLGLILCQAVFGWETVTFERRCYSIPQLLSAAAEPRELDPRFRHLPPEALEKLRLLLKDMLEEHSFNRIPSMSPVKARLREICALLPDEL